MGIYAPPEWQRDPAQVKRIGVVVGAYLFVVEHRDPRKGAPLAIVRRESLYGNDPAELAGAAFEYRCGAVWVMQQGYRLWFDADDPAYVWHELSSDGAIAGLVAQVRGEDGTGWGMPLGIYAPHVNDAWGVAGALRDLAGPREFAEGVALAAFALGQQLRFSPSYTGNAMLRAALADYERRTGREIPPLGEEWREKLYQWRPSPVQWRRPIIAGPGDFFGGDGHIAIHVYDRNMSYVSSAREVPVGDPVETYGYWPHRPGVYLPEFGGAVWEPQLRAPMTALPPEVQEEIAGKTLTGYYWPKGHTIDLRAWSERVWEARRAAHAVPGPAGRIAEALVKRVGVSAIGRLIQHTGRAVMSSDQAKAEGNRILSYESDDAGELTGNVEVEARIGRDDLVCPHWWGTIISNANERLEHAIATYASADTVLAYVDQFYCLNRHPELEGDPMQAGGWKSGGSFTIPLADLDDLNAEGVDAQALVKRFAAYQRAQGRTS